MYPDNIVSVGRKKAFMGKMESLRFELQATPFIEDTWHEQPLVDGSAEDGKKKVSNWSSRVEKDHFPKLVQGGSATNAVPKDITGGKAKEMLPTGLKVSFAKEDKAYEKFIDGPPLVKSGEVSIEGPFSHGPTHVKVKVDKNTVKAEKFSREALRECFGVTTMLQMLSKRLKRAIEGELSSEEGEAWEPAAELKLTLEWLELVLISSFRTGAFIQSIQVMTKDSLREETLENLYGNHETKRNLRHSHYASDNMFGPLSSDFEPYVSPSSLSHEKYKLVPKWGSAGSSPQDKGFFNRPSISSGIGQNKRGSNPHWGASNNKRGNHSGNFVKPISPQEALRTLAAYKKSRGNSNSQPQNFRGNWGRGKKPFRGPWNQTKGRGYRK